MNDELTAVDIKKMEEEIRYRQLELRPKILEDVKTKDTGAISDMLTQLVAELKGFDVDEGKKGGLFGLFKKHKNFDDDDFDDDDDVEVEDWDDDDEA